MDNHPTLKTELDGSSSVKRVGVSGDAERMGGVQDQNYFTPSLMEIWPKVLNYVTDSKDVLSAMNASTLFYSLLENRKASALLPLVLPILINQNTDRFAEGHVFNCRLVSKRMRTSVDNFLINYKHRRVFLGVASYALYVEGASQDLLAVPPGINWNPFVARYCALSLEEEDQTNDLEVLKRHGHELHKVNIIFGSDSTPETEMDMLKRALGRLPNLQSLKLQFPGMAVDEWEEWTFHQAFRTSAHYLPALNSLTELKLKTGCAINGRVNPVPSFFRRILLTYNNHLTSLYCEWIVFGDNSWSSISFPHLRHLEVAFPIIGGSSEWIKNLAAFQCPQLRSLTFFVNDLGTEIFLALNNFRSSLKKLHFKLSLGAALRFFTLDPLYVREFPRLTCLILSPDDTGTPARHMFRIMFPKLKELKFQYASSDQRIPDETVRSGYFTMFPDLKRITWIRKEYRAGDRPPLYTETVFRRQNGTKD